VRTNPYDAESTFVTLHGVRLQWVAWHRGGANTLAVGKRHLRLPGEAKTLCKVLVGRGSKRVSPAVVSGAASWHTGDCSRCVREAARRWSS
jgi:hypothetical protein